MERCRPEADGSQLGVNGGWRNRDRTAEMKLLAFG